MSSNLYDKRNAFNFSIVRFPYRSSNTPSKMFYATISAEVLRIAKATSKYSFFLECVHTLLVRMKKQGADVFGIQKAMRKMIGRHAVTFSKFDKSVEIIISDCQWLLFIIFSFCNRYTTGFYLILPDIDTVNIQALVRYNFYAHLYRLFFEFLIRHDGMCERFFDFLILAFIFASVVMIYGFCCLPTISIDMYTSFCFYRFPYHCVKLIRLSGFVDFYFLLPGCVVSWFICCIALICRFVCNIFTHFITLEYWVSTDDRSKDLC